VGSVFVAPYIGNGVANKAPVTLGSEDQVLSRDATSDGTEWATIASGITIGDAITGGAANRILFEDGSNQVGQSAGFVFDGAQLGINNATPAAMADIQTNATDAVGLIITATASQTADLATITDSVGAGLFAVEPDRIRGYVQMEGPKDASWLIGGGSPVQEETSQIGQDLTVSGGDATAGSVSGTAVGGTLTLRGGQAAANGSSAGGGSVVLRGGKDHVGYDRSGSIELTGMRAANSASVIINAGRGTGTHGDITIASATALSSTDTLGSILIQGSIGYNGGATAQAGSDVTIQTQRGINNTHSSFNSGGDGGALSLLVGGGGSCNVNPTGVGGDASVFAISGSAAGEGAGTGGNGGAWAFTGSAGGDAVGAAGTHVAGNGSSLTLTSGAGGSATGGSGTRTGGASGDITLDIGAVGTGADANGAIGNVNLAVSRGNVGIGTATHDGTLQGGVTIANGTAPSSGLTDATQLYSADQTAGNACLHAVTELGDVIKLYKTATGYTTFSNLSTDRTCDANSTTVEELADILGTLIEDLKNTGLIAA